MGNVATMIDFERLAVDGFFSAEKGGEEMEYGYKGKGVTAHVLTDGQGNPLKITATASCSSSKKNQRISILVLKIFPMISYRKEGTRNKKRTAYLEESRKSDSVVTKEV